MEWTADWIDDAPDTIIEPSPAVRFAPGLGDELDTIIDGPAPSPSRLDDLDDLLDSLPTMPAPALREPMPPPVAGPPLIIAPHLMRPLTIARPSRLRLAFAAVSLWFRRAWQGPGAR